MKFKFIFGVVSVIIITLLSWWRSGVISSGRPVPNQVTFLVEVKDQTQNRRTFRDLQFEQISHFGGQDDTVLLNPNGILVTQEGEIYIRDYGTFQIKLFNSDGRLEKIYGYGKGQGPGESVNAGDFGVSPNGHVWICDLGLKLDEFDKDGRFVGTIKDVGSPYRMTMLDNDRIAVVPLYRHQDILQIYNSAGQMLAHSGPIIEQQEHFSMALGGKVKNHPEHERILYISRDAGLLICYDYNMNLCYLRRMIKPPDFPEIKIINQRGSTTRTLYFDRLKTEYISFSVTDVEIHVLTSQKIDNESKQYVIDVYGIQNGNYLYSYYPPINPINEIYIKDHHKLYTISNAVVNIWKWSKE
jgi:hypothetical protein